MERPIPETISYSETARDNVGTEITWPPHPHSSAHTSVPSEVRLTLELLSATPRCFSF